MSIQTTSTPQGARVSDPELLEQVSRDQAHQELLTEGEEQPLSNEDLAARFKAELERKKALDNEQLRKMEKRARCALLPSPEKLDESIFSPGSDMIGTLQDFKLVKEWLKREKLHTGFYANDEEREQLETGEFGSLISLAFNNAFDAMRHTASPELPELVFWYYAGHGLGKENASQLYYSSTPSLGDLLNSNYNDVANEFVKSDRKVKGGELCLHKYGFCDLYGLLKPWIAAVKADSINATGAKKKNKHLVIILDSCHSGVVAEELREFQQLAQEIDPTLLVENSVTVQAACSPDERTYGGYFTPCFVYLNDPENAELLNKLKNQWENMDEQEKTVYRSIDLPSPMVVTTRPSSQTATMEVEVQNFKLTLFQCPGFFKFCSIKVYQHQDMKFLEANNDRALTSASANVFMNSGNFSVLDYKLKKYQGWGPSDPNAGTPMGLFLLKDPTNPGFAVCAHIHFARGNTNTHTRINLVHHQEPPIGNVHFTEYIEDGPKIQVLLTHGNATRLVQACRQYVNSKKPPGRWGNVTQWNMTGLGVNGLFRQRERSAWKDNYLKNIEKFDLPKVASTGIWGMPFLRFLISLFLSKSVLTVL